MKLVRQCALVLLLTTASSCAMLMSDKEDDVNIGSNPSGADIFIEGKNYGKTPATLHIEAKNQTVVLNKEGYGSTQLQLEAWATMKNGSCSMDVLTSIFPWSLYSAQYSGRCNEFKKKEYFVTIPQTATAGRNSMLGVGQKPEDMINYYYNPGAITSEGISPEQQQYQKEYQQRNQQYPGQTRSR